MVVHKRKKVNKYRAHTTHGGGHRKKRRGAGSRGGRGNAGSGKRSGHKKIGKVLGKNGFRPRRSMFVAKPINLSFFTEEKLLKLVQEGIASEKEGMYILDLNKLGFNKLLGTGNSSLKMEITVERCSAKAAEKIEAAGGKIIKKE